MCEFCILFDFSTVRTRVENGHARIEKAPEGIPFLKKDSFNFCPMCGALLESQGSRLSKAFPKNLRRVRRMRGFTQEAVARELGMQRAAICKYEKGRSVPSIRKFEKLCQILDVSPQELM